MTAALERPPPSKRLKRALRYAAVRAAVGLVGALPIRLAGLLGEWFGAWAYELAASERRKALDSLATAFPEKSFEEREAIALGCFRHLGRCAFEVCCVRQIDRDQERWIAFPEADRQVLDAALARGKGVVFVSGHLGNWELLGRRLGRTGYPTYTIAKATTDPRLTRLVERFRGEGRIRIIWRGQDGAAKEMLRALREGAILGLFIDQDTRVQSVFVPFFGRPASTPRAAADLALRSGAAVVVGFCHREEGGRYRLSVTEVPVPQGGRSEEATVSLTARMTEEIERAIRQRPEQWVWMHRRWRTQAGA
jgi:KDO2-lipid IV(A) lauroyltransferase